MATSPILNYIPTVFYGENVRVDEVLMETGGTPFAPFKASRIRVLPGSWTPLDDHDEKECWFIISGEGELVFLEREKKIVRPGDVMFYDSRQSHKIYNSGKEDLIIISIWWT